MIFYLVLIKKCLKNKNVDAWRIMRHEDTINLKILPEPLDTKLNNINVR